MCNETPFGVGKIYASTGLEPGTASPEMGYRNRFPRANKGIFWTDSAVLAVLSTVVCTDRLVEMELLIRCMDIHPNFLHFHKGKEKTFLTSSLLS